MNWMLPLFFAFSCHNPSSDVSIPDSLGKILPPSSYELTTGDKASFTTFLKSLPLKKENKVLLYNGEEKSNQQASYAVIDMEIGRQNLQQCADAVMRLRSEWLFKNKKYAAISYHFVNGQEFPYNRYAEGYRPVFKGNKFTWVKSATTDYSYKTFRKYLDLLFSYAGTASLIKEVKKVKIETIAPGDIFIQSRNPYGHAVIVVAVAVNKGGERKFLLAQSYMPAQETHVLNNFNAADGEPWYDAVEGVIETPEWTFHSNDLYRFP